MAENAQVTSTISIPSSSSANASAPAPASQSDHPQRQSSLLPHDAHHNKDAGAGGKVDIQTNETSGKYGEEVVCVCVCCVAVL
jgi:hypothetical protein